MPNFTYISSRMLIPTTELGRFDSMVMPFELEAYDILKSHSCKHKHILISVGAAQASTQHCRDKIADQFKIRSDSLWFALSVFSSSTFSSWRNPSTSPHHSDPRYLAVALFQSRTLLILDLNYFF